MADRGCMAVQVEIRERGLGLLRPRLNVGPVCDDIAPLKVAYAQMRRYISEP